MTKSLSDAAIARSMEAAGFFDRLATTVSRVKSIRLGFLAELMVPEQYEQQVRDIRAYDEETKRLRREIADERERWFAERRTA